MVHHTCSLTVFYTRQRNQKKSPNQKKLKEEKEKQVAAPFKHLLPAHHFVFLLLYLRPAFTVPSSPYSPLYDPCAPASTLSAQPEP